MKVKALLLALLIAGATALMYTATNEINAEQAIRKGQQGHIPTHG